MFFWGEELGNRKTFQGLFWHRLIAYHTHVIPLEYNF